MNPWTTLKNKSNNQTNKKILPIDYNPTNVSRIENKDQNLVSSSNKSSSIEELINLMNKKNNGSLNPNENNNEFCF